MTFDVSVNQGRVRIAEKVASSRLDDFASHSFPAEILCNNNRNDGLLSLHIKSHVSNRDALLVGSDIQQTVRARDFRFIPTQVICKGNLIRRKRSKTDFRTVGPLPQQATVRL